MTRISSFILTSIAIIFVLLTTLWTTSLSLSVIIEPLRSKPPKPTSQTPLSPPVTPLRLPPQAPIAFNNTPASFNQEVSKTISRSRNVLDEIKKKTTPETAAFDNVLRPMAQDENLMMSLRNFLVFQQLASPHQEIRTAAIDALAVLNDYLVEASTREDMFKLVDAVMRKKEDLDPESQRLLENEYRNNIRDGLHVPPGPERIHLEEVEKRISQLLSIFQQNLINADSGLWFTPQELDGLPEYVISRLEAGTGENEGRLFLTFEHSDVSAALQYVADGEIREKIFIANENKCPENIRIFEELIVLRDEAARLLGYPDWAAFRIEAHMAKNTTFVNDFLEDLRSGVIPIGVEEVKYLKQLKSHHLESEGKKMDADYYLWDQKYYDRLLMEQEYNIDQHVLAEYFPLETTLERTLQIFESLFGLEFVKMTRTLWDELMDPNAESGMIWHETVDAYSVWDNSQSGGSFVGYLYLDLFPRVGKTAQASTLNLHLGYIDKDGHRHYPSTAVLCNFPMPTAKKPSLLKHDEVVILFHELGHAMHDLLGRVTYSRFHGTHVASDFAEFPSKILENWAWSSSILSSLGHHYSYISPEYLSTWKDENPHADANSLPPVAIPNDLISRLIGARRVGGALNTLRQIHIASFDIKIHSPPTHASLLDPSFSIAALYNDLRASIIPVSGPEVDHTHLNKWAHGYTTFSHLVTGYDAGYYGYLLSTSFAADAFMNHFSQDPLNVTEGKRYRDTILEKGGARDEMEMLVDFLGRRPSTVAFYRELGIGKGGLTNETVGRQGGGD